MLQGQRIIEISTIAQVMKISCEQISGLTHNGEINITRPVITFNLKYCNTDRRLFNSLLLHNCHLVKRSYILRANCQGS